MTTYVFRNGAWVDKATAAPLHPAHGRFPHVIRDQIDPMRSMADGRMFDSKSAYYASLKDQGCEIVGNDRGWLDQQPTFEPQGVGDSIKQAIEELKHG